jgi:catechol-2,3-dioxygenase
MAIDTATVAQEIPAPTIETYARLAHVGISGPDPRGLAAFYAEMFGLELTSSFQEGPLEAAFASSRPTEEHHEVAIFNADQFRHIAFKVERAADLAAYYRVVKAKGLPIVFVADHGTSVAIMFVDPAGNLVEVYLPTNVDGRIVQTALDEDALMARLAELS